VRSSIADARPTAPRSRAPVPAATVHTPRSVLVRARRPATLADGPHSRVADRRSGSGTASRGTYTAAWPESARAIAPHRLDRHRPRSGRIAGPGAFAMSGPMPFTSSQGHLPPPRKLE
jgi:hypothetical protein